nr:hypothetical protein [uncultured Porphyromonas sp.]
MDKMIRNNEAVNVILEVVTRALPYGRSGVMKEGFRAIAEALSEKSGYPVSDEAVEHLWMEQGIALYDDSESAVYTDKKAGYTLSLYLKPHSGHKIFVVREAKDGDQPSNKGQRFLESLEEAR